MLIIGYLYFKKCLINLFVHFVIWIICSFGVKPFALYFLDIYPLLDSWQIVSHSSGHLFTWFSFTVQKPFSLMQYHCQLL